MNILIKRKKRLSKKNITEASKRAKTATFSGLKLVSDAVESYTKDYTDQRKSLQFFAYIEGSA